MINAVELNHNANNGKIDSIINLLTPWQQTLNNFIKLFQHNLHQGNKNNKYESTKAEDLTFNTALNARQIKSVRNQAIAAYNSYLALKEENIRELINGSTINPTDKTILYRINAQQSWYCKILELAWLIDENTGELTVPQKKDYKNNADNLVWLPVEQELLKLSRNMFKHSRVSLPNLKKCNTMIMDGIIAKRGDGGSTIFDYWLKITSLVKGSPVSIPLYRNSYYNDKLTKSRKVSSVVQVQVLDGNSVSFRLLLDEANAQKRDGRKLGLDSNFNDSNLFSDSDGRLFGGAFVRWVKEMDERLLAREKWVRTRGLSLKNDRVYQNLLKRVRGFTRNEVGRIINRLLGEGNPGGRVGSLVVESLDFRGGGLSRRLNRLLTRMGRGVLRDKLGRVGESHGVSIVRVNAAYSSQECSSCHFVSRGNRVGRLFVCECCKLKLHADVNSPRVLVGRCSVDGSDAFGNISVVNTRGRLEAAHAAVCGVHARLLSRVAGPDKVLLSSSIDDFALAN